MNKTGWTLAILSLIIIVAAIILFVLPSNTKAPTTPAPQATTTPISQIPDLIVVDSLHQGDKISSPLTIVGRARGTWYFEASFPVEVRNASGTVIAVGPAQAQSDWMTQDFVPFSITLSFPAEPAGSAGTVVLHKDNPSGLPENDNSLTIPVVF